MKNGSFLISQAEEMERLISELARVAVGERALIDECGDLLSKTNTFLVSLQNIFSYLPSYEVASENSTWFMISFLHLITYELTRIALLIGGREQFKRAAYAVAIDSCPSKLQPYVIFSY